MSRAGAAVRFPDGKIKYGIYNGTSDIMQARLFDAIEAAWDAWSSNADMWPTDAHDDSQAVPVTIYSDYGGGYYWGGLATREFITEGHLACGYPWCRSCADPHRAPECAINEQGQALASCGHPWDDVDKPGHYDDGALIRPSRLHLPRRHRSPPGSRFTRPPQGVELLWPRHGAEAPRGTGNDDHQHAPARHPGRRRPARRLRQRIGQRRIQLRSAGSARRERCEG